jgi:hypothetical protein
MDILSEWQQSNHNFSVPIESEPTVLQPSAGPGPISTPGAGPTLEDKWRRYFVVLVIATVLTSLIAIGVAVMTSRRSESGSAGTTSAENVGVWTDDHTGRYFCADSVWYGKTRAGRYLTQKEARFTGFRPADGKPCAISQLSR